MQTQVSGSTYRTVLKNLDMDTEYRVTVVPVYSLGEGQPMSENGKTCKCSPSFATTEIRAGVSSADLEDFQGTLELMFSFVRLLRGKKKMIC